MCFCTILVLSFVSPVSAKETPPTDTRPSSATLEHDESYEVATDSPHNSHHAPGTINVEGRTFDCTSNMPFMKVSVSLRKGSYCWGTSCWSWTNVGNSGSKQANHKKKVKSNAWVNCADGVYKGVTTHEITFPSGHQISALSQRTAKIKC